MRSSAARGLGLAGKPLAAKAVPALLALSALLVGALLGGCSDDPEPAGRLPDPTSSAAMPSVSSVPTPSPSASTRSVEAEVEAAVRAYYAELTRAAQTNDTSRLKRLVRKSCPCYRAIRVIDNAADVGERSPDVMWSVKSVAAHDVVGRTASAEVKYRVNAYDVTAASGETVAHFPADAKHLDLFLIRNAARWVVVNLREMDR